MKILPNSSCLHTTVWIHHVNVNEMHGEKTRWELHKNTSHCLEQILEVTLPQNCSCMATYCPSKMKRMRSTAREVKTN